MNIRVLCLDDDKEFTDDLKTNISALGDDFFRSVGGKITKIEVVTASEPSEAFKIINDPKENISLLIVDIELRSTKGHEEYDRLFREGKSIPAIVVSAFANTPERRQAINSTGVSVIIDKYRQECLSEEIARKVCWVLDSPSERILQLRMIVEKLRIHRLPLAVNGRTLSIEDWFKLVVARKLQPDEEEALRQEITNECGRRFRLEQDHGKGFKREEL